jgi:serine/threonine-protein kinase
VTTVAGVPWRSFRPEPPGSFVRFDLQVDEWIALGGMAATYRVRDLRTDRRAFLKLGHVARDAAVERSFDRERDALTAIRSVHVPRLIEHGRLAGGRPHLLMPWYEAPSLATVLAGSAVTVYEAAQIADQLLAALADVHDAGFAHGDVKPGNVLVRADDDLGVPLWLVDFGVSARHDRPRRNEADPLRESVFGTPQYMAPERFIDGDVDVSSDVYAVGVVLYEMLVGSPPLAGRPTSQVVHAIVNGAGIRVDALARRCPTAVVSVVERALAWRADERFSSARSMRTALRRAAAGSFDRPTARLARNVVRRTTDVAASAIATMPIPLVHGRGGTQRLFALETTVHERSAGRTSRT